MDGSVTLQRFSVVPLVFGKDGPNVDLSILVNIWEDLVATGKDQDLFYDGGVGSATEWVLFLHPPQVFPLLVWDSRENDVALVAWLTDVKLGSANVHHVWLRPFRRDICQVV